jgi:quinol monooxygenase YgiN
MSVLVVVKVTGDTATFQQALTDRADEFESVATRAKAAGAIHHRFGIGDGVVVVVDEWETADGFQQFFGDPAMQEFVSSIGAAPGPPEIMIAEAISSADEF